MYVPCGLLLPVIKAWVVHSGFFLGHLEASFSKQSSQLGAICASIKLTVQHWWVLNTKVQGWPGFIVGVSPGIQEIFTDGEALLQVLVLDFILLLLPIILIPWGEISVLFLTVDFAAVDSRLPFLGPGDNDGYCYSH